MERRGEDDPLEREVIPKRSRWDWQEATKARREP
jgi:hypothetical protein